MLTDGALLNNRYRITRPIGRGGMGAVYEAVDSRLQNAVAVKEMTAKGLDVDRAFQREAELLAGLRHPALPVVIDYFVDAGGQFLIMQYIDGEDLARVRARQGGACAPDDVLAWAVAVLDALQYLHEHDPPIVHRDIKPANLKRTPRGEIVLLDFGLAKGRPDAQATVDLEERSLFGYTPGYAPVEQIEWRGTDARSDLYALGATIYHLVTGAPPPSAPDRAAAVRGGRPDPLVAAHLANCQVSDRFSQVIGRALEIAARDRFESAVAMRAALEDAREQPARPPAQPGSATDRRRVDAAMPSHADVGRQIDLIVQVRFAASPLLGLEDWPSRHLPPQIEQGSEPLQLVYPVNPQTGRPMPARIQIRIVAPDFVVEGQAQHVVEVPPDDYSKRLAFLLTPHRAGLCRVNLEVYGPDSLHLGTIPIETEAMLTGLARPIQRVANLVLGLFVRERVVPDPTADESAAPTPALLYEVHTHASPSSHLQPQGPPDHAVRMPTAAQPPPASSAAREGKLWIIASGAAILIAAVAVPQYLSRQSSAPVEQTTLASGPPTSVPTPAAHTSSVTMAPVTAPPRPVPRAAAAPMYPSATVEQTTLASGPPASVPTPTPTPAPLAPMRPGPPAPRMSPPLHSPDSVRVNSDHPDVVAVVTSMRSGTGRIRLRLWITNGSSNPARIAFDYSQTNVRDANDKPYAVIADSTRTAPDRIFTTTVAAGDTLEHWIEFAQPDGSLRVFTATLATPTGRGDLARFQAFTITLPQ